MQSKMYDVNCIKIDDTVSFAIASSIYVPKEPGIYYFHDIRGIFYVGRSDNLQRRYHEHLKQESNKKLQHAYKTSKEVSFSWHCVTGNEQLQLERKLIETIDPICNHIHKPKLKSL